MTARMIAVAWIAATLLIGGAAVAAADPVTPTLDRPLIDPRQESAARALMREIRCVVCQSQSIDDSEAEIAAELRNIIREQIKAGRSNQEIRDYLTARYGDFVLLAPPFKAKTVILWLGPFALAAIGLAGVLMTLRRDRRAKGNGSARAFVQPELTRAERTRIQEALVAFDTQGSEVP